MQPSHGLYSLVPLQSLSLYVFPGRLRAKVPYDKVPFHFEPNLFTN